MVAKLSVDQALTKASYHLKNDEIFEAKKLYQAVLLAFPKNIRAQKGLANLNKSKLINISANPPQEIFNQLVKIYNQGQLSEVIKQAKRLTEEYPESFYVWNILGASTVQLKMFNESIKAYKKCIFLNPDYAEAYNNMAVALKRLGKLDEAIVSLKKCVSINPNHAEALNNLGNVFKEQGYLDKASEAYKRSITAKPDYADAYINLATVFSNQGKLEKAIEAYKTSILLKPDSIISYINMGNALKKKGQLDKAIEAYKKCINLKPDHAIAYNNLGKAFQEQGKQEKAIECYKKSISFDQNYADPHINMGNVFQEKLKVNDAIIAYKHALSINPKYAEAYNSMGVALREQGEVEEAIKALKKCISLNPNHSEAYNNMGMTLQFQGKLEEAINAYEKAISFKPDYALAHQNLSYSLLNSGRIKDGLEKNEWRWKVDKFLKKQRHFLQPLWDGKKSLNGKRILLWCEQGIGDTINWSSCIPLILSKGANCIVECQEKLIPLLKRSFPNLDVITENRSLDLKRDDFDFHLPMGSLYKHFIKEISQNTKANAFLFPDPVRVNFWRDRLASLGNGPYIGISWKSSQISTLRLPNYSYITEWSPILSIPNVTFINLQYVDFENDLKTVKDKFGVTVHNFNDLDHYNNISDVAALANALDMVISNKTTVPLISAGVGTVTKLASWRQSSWNNILTNPVGPSVDIYERDIWEPWNRVFNLIAKDISKLIINRSF